MKKTVAQKRSEDKAMAIVLLVVTITLIAVW